MATAQLRRLGVPAIFKPDDHGVPESADIFCAAGNPGRFSDLDVLADTEHFRLVTTPFPKAPGQLLIVTKSHLRTFGDIPVTWHRELRRLTDFGMQFQREIYGKETCLREQGSSLRQSVPHAHLHLLPVSSEVAVPNGYHIAAHDWLALAKYKLRHGEYYFMQFRDRGLIVPDTGGAVRHAEWAVCQAIPGRWNEEKTEPEGDRSPAGLQRFEELTASWQDWTERSRVRYQARIAKINVAPGKPGAMLEI